jgi:hypothetical protein
MSAMRARLSTLSTAVDKKDEERAQERFMTHRYYQEEPVTATKTAQPAAALSTLRERDVNVTSRGVFRKPASITETAATVSASTSYPHAAATLLDTENPSIHHGRGVEVMLHLARQHASATCGLRHHDSALTPTRLHTYTGGEESKATLPPPPLPAPQADFSGLRTYDFQERFPTPRRVALPPPHVAPDTAEPKDCHGHRYAQGDSVVGAASANASFTSVSSSAHSSRAAAAVTGAAATPFDAFRVVQERLRQKMRQLTSGVSTTPATTLNGPSSVSVSPQVSTLQTASQVSHKAAAPHQVEQATRDDASDQQREDSSPPPRPPPGARAATATPFRSPTPSADASHASTVVPPPSARLHPSAIAQESQQYTPIELEPSGAQQSQADHVLSRHHKALYDPETGEAAESEQAIQRHREYGYEKYTSSYSTSASSANSSAQHHAPSSPPLEVFTLDTEPTRHLARANVGAAPGAFSDPTGAASSMMRQQPRHTLRPAALVGSQRTSLRPHSGVGSQKRPSASRLRSEGRSHAHSRATHRVGSTSPSPSHPRERSTTGSQLSRPWGSAPRTKPISLNVEATILASVTGAELFALLRMRGLIDSEGDTEEYRLPPARCHRLYVTADELRQLQMLRQSIQAVEEDRKDVPSYQRPTLSARSRNAEFAPPPPVTHFMDH